MAKFKLFPRENSCAFYIELSSLFKYSFYQELKITKKYSGKVVDSRNMSDAGDVLIIEPTDDIKSGSGDVKTNGRTLSGNIYFLKAKKRYKFYSYALARNGIWYLVGEDYVKPLETKKINLSISDASGNDEYFKTGESEKIKVKVKNLGNVKSSKYKIKVYDENQNLIGTSNKLNGIKGENSEWIHLYIKGSKSGKQTLKFSIEDIDDNQSENKVYFKNFIFVKCYLKPTTVKIKLNGSKLLALGVLSNASKSAIKKKLKKEIMEQVAKKLGASLCGFIAWALIATDAIGALITFTGHETLEIEIKMGTKIHKKMERGKPYYLDAYFVKSVSSKLK